jgi:uncharacterized protein (DUF1015 family)
MYGEEVYRKAHDMLCRQIQDGIFQQDEVPCFYLYELTMNGHTQTGLVACASVDDYLNQVIRRHENTRAEKEADRIRHVDVCDMQTGPIFLTYRSDPVIRGIVEQVKAEDALFDFCSSDGIRHRGWMIRSEEQTDRIVQTFAGIGRIYIADGHHRAASAVKVGLKRREQHPDYTGKEAFNYFLSILFPDDELQIMAYNRVVRDLNGHSETSFLQAVSEHFALTPLPGRTAPQQKGSFTMFLNGKWYRLDPRSHVDAADPVASLDVTVLQNQLLAPILGIQNPSTDQRIGFVGGIRGLQELERRVQTDCAVAFALFPTSIHEMFAVADAGLLMPPKATWFEPKLRSGLFLHPLSETEEAR